MLTLRSPLIAVVLGLATLPAQVPAHSSPMLQTPANPDFRVVQQGDAVHISEPSRIYLRSLDGGRTWPVLPQLLPVTRVTDFVCGSAFLIAAGVDGTNPYVPSIARSTDGGATWNGPIPVSISFLHTIGNVRVHI